MSIPPPQKRSVVSSPVAIAGAVVVIVAIIAALAVTALQKKDETPTPQEASGANQEAVRATVVMEFTLTGVANTVATLTQVALITPTEKVVVQVATAIPPTAVPPTAVPPTAIPLTNTSVPPTAIPPTAVPPTNTAVPPTATPIPPTSTPVPPTVTPIPPTAVPPSNTPVPPTAIPQPQVAAPQSDNVVWTQASISAPTTLGNSTGWTVFQMWDGRSVASVVHGVIEPSWTVAIPSSMVGTQWTVTGIDRDALLIRVVAMRQEVVARDNLPQPPPLIYIGSGVAPSPFVTTYPSGWIANNQTADANVNCSAKVQGPLQQGDHSLSGVIHIVQLWRQSGNSPWKNGLVTAIVKGDFTVVQAGGQVWTYPSLACETRMKDELAASAQAASATIVTEADLRQAGIIR